MKKSTLIIISIGVLFMVNSASATTIIDNFETPGRSNFSGTQWQGFADSVMGGVSRINARYESENNESYLRMSGKVSLDNNGGFIQTRLFLDPRGRPVDLSKYNGIRMKVRGQGDSYFIHVRTDRTAMPWAYYAAPIRVTENWQDVNISFSDFRSKGMALSSRLNTKRIRSLAVVAAWKNFNADISIAEISLY
jgi:hypothetical protein